MTGANRPVLPRGRRRLAGVLSRGSWLITLIVNKEIMLEPKLSSTNSASCTWSSWHSLEKVLIEKGASIHDRIFGYTILHVCAVMDWRDLAVDLLTRGMDVDTLKEKSTGDENSFYLDYGCTPLMLSCCEGHMELACLFIDRGARFDLKNGVG